MAETQKARKYSEEDVLVLTEGYNPNNTVESVIELADTLNKTIPSIRAKLVSLGIYVAPEKSTKVAKDEGPSKKDLIAVLVALTGRQLEGIEGATKPALAEIIEVLQNGVLQD